jgi:ABC-2 type transport system permease protein
MFRRIGNLLAKDLLYSRRESILVYSMTAMLVMAVGALFFLPSLEQMDIRIAVDGSVPPEVARQLEGYGRVEHYASLHQLRERVLAFDDVPGIYYTGGEYVVLLEGNEESYVRELPGAILDRILQGEDVVELSTVSLGRERSPVREYTTIFFLLSMFLVGGLVIGLSIIDDRQSGTIRALAVTPLNVIEYMLGKSILGLLVVVALTLAVATILLGPATINYPLLLISVTASLGVAIAIGFLIGLVSDNMITAIGLLKVIALPISGVPMAALFLPDRLKWLLYPFPNYWSFESFNRMFIRTDLPLAPVNLAAALFSLGLVAALVSRFGRKLRLTVRGGE